MEIVQEEVEFTVLMPCLNEAETLATCIRKAQNFLARLSIRGEVLVADNGSTDDSPRIAESMGARVVSVSQCGYGAALGRGIQAARGRYVIMGDADDSYDFSCLDGFVEKLRGGAQLVMGNRFKGGIQPNAMPFLHRYLGNPLLSFLGRLFFKVPCGDFHCGLRGFSRQAVLDLNLQTIGMEFASEMIVQSKFAGLHIEEIPTSLSPDGRSRQPHLRTWRDGWRHLRFLLMYSPRWLFLYPGSFFLLMGILLVLWLAWGEVKIGSVTFSQKTFSLGCLLLMLGVQCVCLGIFISQYASRHNILPGNVKFQDLLSNISSENILFLSAAFFSLAAAGIVYVMLRWAQVDFGPLDDSNLEQLTVISVSFFAISAQLFFTSFTLSILSLELRTQTAPRAR